MAVRRRSSGSWRLIARACPEAKLVASMSATVELSISADVGEIARVQEAVAVLAGDHVLSARLLTRWPLRSTSC